MIHQVVEVLLRLWSPALREHLIPQRGQGLGSLGALRLLGDALGLHRRDNLLRASGTLSSLCRRFRGTGFELGTATGRLQGLDSSTG